MLNVKIKKPLKVFAVSQQSFGILFSQACIADAPNETKVFQKTDQAYCVDVFCFESQTERQTDGMQCLMQPHRRAA